ncbi:FkbM family methyltransferase [Candidatus Woesearchaeota archaeon]|nr:FkbM family methyltransferase [Candidatus Woesearchaeota archaeon]
MILQRIFGRQSNGFYIDVGAHHPKRFSNTFFFYKKGWNGINIDAMPGSMKSFKIMRPRDMNLEIPISDKKETLKYYIFDQPALNGFSRKISLERNKNKNKIVKTKYLKTSTLKAVLDQHLPKNKEIDFLSIDVEGLDYNVLKSNDWKKYRPRYVLIEILSFDLESMKENKIFKFMNEKGYKIFGKCVNTVIFKKK